MATAEQPPTPRELAERLLALDLHLADAHARNDQRSINGFTAEIVAIASKFPADALGQPLLVAPCDDLKRTVNSDGLAYEVKDDTQSGFIQFQLFDVTGDNAMAHFTEQQVRLLIRDLSAVLAAKESRRG